MSHPIPGHDYDEETLPGEPQKEEDETDTSKYIVPPTEINDGVEILEAKNMEPESELPE